ncbi:hypothetical protein BG28_11870 [Nesterenkonia sp. AN1]|uniref:Uncharacterized protein n=1 Tax=Nesterenkonia aurantiaca TaxID=1436010 RepID=A0A4R7G7M8_9MICC|nr:hypothetical protein [Nesterenkonia]EXF25594.1 hypothetical protein BG28_11870 [Nesterenkonia sp. AN1]TDS87456.1 hypothetical protein EV640_101240 [Nesterenkonia aurantiaca]
MTVPLAFTAAAPAAPELPDWAPLVFGIGSLLLLVLVIVLARRKMQDSARWQEQSQQGTETDGPRKAPRKNPRQDPRQDPDPRRDDGA